MTARDRKATLKATPLHVDFILKFGQDEYDKLNKEVDEEIIFCKIQEI